MNMYIEVADVIKMRDYKTVLVKTPLEEEYLVEVPHWMIQNGLFKVGSRIPIEISNSQEQYARYANQYNYPS
jgi:hypothetical protein